MDIIAVGTLLLSRRFFKEAVKLYDVTYDTKVTEIADYTILVTGLPRHESESEVEEGLHECAPMILQSYCLSEAACSLDPRSNGASIGVWI
jgi:hypothetical protein